MMSERKFRVWATLAAIVTALLPWLIFPWRLAEWLGPVIGILAAGGLANYIVRANSVYRRR